MLHHVLQAQVTASKGRLQHHVRSPSGPMSLLLSVERMCLNLFHSVLRERKTRGATDTPVVPYSYNAVVLRQYSTLICHTHSYFLMVLYGGGILLLI